MTALPTPPSGQHFNLLEEPLIRVVLKTPSEGAAEDRLTLPETLAALMRDEVLSFPAMRPHHRPAWHMFATQLGALALLRAKSTELPEDGESWKTLLRELVETETETGAQAQKLGDAPWCLVVDDQTLPAFLQPPTPTPLLPSKKEPPTFVTPDEMDLTVTAKNFDLKRSIIRHASPDDWFFALISFQTMNGYTGRGHQGIARMNGGFSSRPLFSLCPLTGHMGAQLKRDLTALLASRESLLSSDPQAESSYRHLYSASETARGLLWLLPWDGGAKSGLSFAQLDLWFIEICRRVRLVLNAQGQLLGMEGTAEKPRVAEGKDRQGNTGDFWAPLELPKNSADDQKGSSLKAYSPTGQGFTNTKICDILFGELQKGGTHKSTWRLPPALQGLPSEKGEALWLDLAVLTRGQGKTEGYHERRLPFGPALRKSIFGSPKTQELLCHMAKQQLEDLSLLNTALGAACAQLAAAGGELRKDHYNSAGPYRKLLDQKAEPEFFTQLNRRVEEIEKTGGLTLGWQDKIATQPCYLEWLTELVNYAAYHLLPQAEQSIPCPVFQVQRTQTRAWQRFWGMLTGKKSKFSAAQSLRERWQKTGADPTNPPHVSPESSSSQTETAS